MNHPSWNQLIASTAMTILLWIAMFAGLLIESTPVATAQSFDTSSSDTTSPLVLEGFTAPYRDIRVGSPDTATIIEVRVDKGNTVRVGQVVARLDDTVAITNSNIARQAAASTGELDASRLQLVTSKRKYEQCLELHGRNHATDQELWNMQASHDDATARFKAYEEMSHRRQLELAQAEANLQRLTIRSPIDGIVIDRLKDIGEIVSPADPHLVRIVQLDPLRINATASIQQSKSLIIGQHLQTKVDNQSVIAIIEFVSPVADASSGSVVVQLRVANPNHRIAAGMQCQISVEPLSTETARDTSRSVPRQTLKSSPLIIKTTR